MKPYGCFFGNTRSEETDIYTNLGGYTTIVKATPLGVIAPKYLANGEDEGQSKIEPYVGLEFDSADDARDFYNVYARQSGFRTRIGQLYRSRVDGSIASRRFVCSKEGFQLNSRTGCPAFMRVKRLESGKWVLDHFHKDHNHELKPLDELCSPHYQGKCVTDLNPLNEVSNTGSAMPLEEEEDDGHPCPSGVINLKRLKLGEAELEPRVEPHVGLEFNSSHEAYKYYLAYAATVGFRIRIGQLFRSKKDGSITSRRFVCSKEGHQHPSRVGCGAYMRIKREDSGRWRVDRLQKVHNHHLGGPNDVNKKTHTALIKIKEEENGPMISQPNRGNNIGCDWYHALFNYFQSKQAEDDAFFYAVDVDDGKCKSIFWADGRSRFSCCQFGDTIVFDTRYRKSTHLVPFASFVGVNHHKQPVLFGCALVADESTESFTWVFRTFLKAMSGRRPVSIVADQDKAIEQAIAQVFTGTHHCFSMWQMKSKEHENLGVLFSVNNEFKDEFEACVYQTQTITEFDSSWSALLTKYNLNSNAWLKEMYLKRKSWVPLYLRRTFFAGIPMSNMTPFFGVLLNAQIPLDEFLSWYERTVKQHQEEEKSEDAKCSTSLAVLRTKEPFEEQCRELYTITIFKLFQKELLDSYGYFGINIHEEGIVCKYLIKRCGNENEQRTVTLNSSDLGVNCSCQMFEFEGILCRHVLKVFHIVDVREIPACYIMNRWTKNAGYGLLRDVESGGSSRDLKARMVWSLREEARRYIEAAATSMERCKLAIEIMGEGRRKFCGEN